MGDFFRALKFAIPPSLIIWAFLIWFGVTVGDYAKAVSICSQQ